MNKQLSDQYKEWFSYIDYLIMLKVPDMESVYEWRELQEKKLIQSRLQHNKYAMSEQALKKFIMYFERITCQCLGEMPARQMCYLILIKIIKLRLLISSNALNDLSILDLIRLFRVNVPAIRP